VNTDTFPIPADWPPRDIAPLADDLALIVHAGKARALALEIVQRMLVAFLAIRHERSLGPFFLAGAAALSQWLKRAIDIESGREQKQPPAQRLTLLDVAGAADLIAANANARRKVENRNGEAWIVYETATALWRACRCDAFPIGFVRIAERDPENAYDAHNGQAIREHHDHTARILLPLLVRDVRALLAEQRVNASAIEAAIIAYGGKVS
jgi:hypothetical protein